MSNCCDVIVYAYSEGRKRRVVNNVPIIEAYDMFGFKMDPAEREKVIEKERKQANQYKLVRKILKKIRQNKKASEQ